MQTFHRSLPLVGRWAGRRTALKPCRTRSTLAGNAFSTSRTVLNSYASGSLAGLKDILRVSEEVTDALATNKPVVALETTIYTHGALGELHLENIVRKHGGVPAVVGVLEGVPTVGLTPEEVKRMVEGSPRKASRRDLAYVVGSVCLGPHLDKLTCFQSLKC